MIMVTDMWKKDVKYSKAIGMFCRKYNFKNYLCMNKWDICANLQGELALHKMFFVNFFMMCILITVYCAKL